MFLQYKQRVHIIEIYCQLKFNPSNKNRQVYRVSPIDLLNLPVFSIIGSDWVMYMATF